LIHDEFLIGYSLKPKIQLSIKTNELPNQNFEIALSKAFLTLDSLSPLDPSQPGWKLQLSKDGVNVFVKEDTSTPFAFFRGDGFIQGQFTVQEILSVIKSPSSRKECNVQRFNSRG